MLLENRIALVTGGASGLGLATATAFAREGATVVINDLRLDAAREAAAKLGERHFAVGGDVSSEDAVNAMVKETLDRFGRIDILVNNAGMPDTTLAILQ